MIKILKGDIFDSDAQTLVNTVNCVGVMGKGIAKGFKQRYPEMFEDYAKMCDRGEVRVGEPYLYKYSDGPWILNFPTKDHWRSLARIESIDSGLQHLLNNYAGWGIKSIAVPPLGTGLGQLEWRIVGPVLYRYLNQMTVSVELYAPLDADEDELELSSLKAGISPTQIPLRAPSLERIGPAWVALVEILKRVQDQPYHWPIGRTRFQKMAYVASAEGLPLDLEFSRGSYGPHAKDLKNSLSRLMNNGLITEHRRGSMFEVLVGPAYSAARDSVGDKLQMWETIIGKVADLFMRTSTRETEVIASAMFVAKEFVDAGRQSYSEKDVLSGVLEWKQQRRPPLEEEEVAAAIQSLASLNWLDVEPSPELDYDLDDFPTGEPNFKEPPGSMPQQTQPH